MLKNFLFVAFIVFLFLTLGCSMFRAKGEPYSGYSCRDSLMHFYSRCYTKQLTKDEFESKVQACEKELSTKVCDKEQADLLWCLGRVEPGVYSSGGGVFFGGLFIDSGNVKDGCDCGSFMGDLKKCRMKEGIFD